MWECALFAPMTRLMRTGSVLSGVAEKAVRIRAALWKNSPVQVRNCRRGNRTFPRCFDLVQGALDVSALYVLCMHVGSKFKFLPSVAEDIGVVMVWNIGNEAAHKKH